MRASLLVLTITACVLGCTPLSLQAQQGPSTGSRVRVTAPSLGSERLVATVAAATMDSLLLSVGGGNATIRLERAALDRLEVSRGRHRFRWALIGAGVGLLGGAIIGSAVGSHEDNSGWGGLIGLLGGATVGLPAGAVGGALLAPEQWVLYHERRND